MCLIKQFDVIKISPPARRGAEADERSESDEVGWWNKFRE
jgi:hypothetical protein